MPKPRKRYIIAVRDIRRDSLQTLLDADSIFGVGLDFKDTFTSEYTDGTNTWYVASGPLTQAKIDRLSIASVSGANLPGWLADGTVKIAQESVQPTALADWGLTPAVVES